MKSFAISFLVAVMLASSGCQGAIGVGVGAEIRVGVCSRCGYLHPANEPCPAQIPEPPQIRPHRQIR